MTASVRPGPAGDGGWRPGPDGCPCAYSAQRPRSREDPFAEVGGARWNSGPGSTGAGRSGGYFAGFAPWIVFDVVASPSTWEYASLAALVTAVLLG
ncbi:hypothetical protein ACFQ1I_46080 [Kitasatospora arboriphila]